MPIYEYECRRCSSRFEMKRAFDDDVNAICHSCGGEARRVFSAVPIFFKGPGFYVTDNAAEDRNKPGTSRYGSKPAGTGNGMESEDESKAGALP